jgi:hypothetical protein
LGAGAASWLPCHWLALPASSARRQRSPGRGAGSVISELPSASAPRTSHTAQ